jgi:hypothetical protein
MKLLNQSRFILLASAGCLMVLYQLNPAPSWACSAGGGAGVSYSSQTNADSVTVCVKSVVETRSGSSSKPVTAPKPAQKPEPKPVPKPVHKPVAKPAPKLPEKVVTKAPAKIVLLTPIKVGVPALLRKPTPAPALKSAPKPAPKPVAKAPTLPSAKPVTPIQKVSSSVAIDEASFSPTALSISATGYSIALESQVSFSSNAKLHYKSATLLGKSTEVRFEPLSVRWSFGDGATVSGVSAAHAFNKTGRFSVGATVIYGVSYQISGSSDWTASGSIGLSDSIEIMVTADSGFEAPSQSVDSEGSTRVRLVGQNCLENPGSFGCIG